MPALERSWVSLRALHTPLGPMLGGATEAGVCLCEFSDRGGEARIIARLEKRHGRAPDQPKAMDAMSGTPSPRQAAHLEALEGELREYFAGTRRSFGLPLDLAGTPWQSKVWSELLKIPYGATTSYGQLAARLGRPGASRAVGRANGENYVAIIVPCHRVIQADGGLRGYGGGLGRKRWLLDLEGGARQLSL